MEINNTLPFELKLNHQIKHKPKAKDFIVDVNVKILRQDSTSPSKEISFWTTVDEFIWEDDDCSEKRELYEFIVDSGIVEFEAQFLVIDMILYVNKKILSLDEEFKGRFTLTAEIRLKPEPIATLTKPVRSKIINPENEEKVMYF